METPTANVRTAASAGAGRFLERGDVLLETGRYWKVAGRCTHSANVVEVEQHRVRHREATVGPCLNGDDDEDEHCEQEYEQDGAWPAS